MAKAKQEVARYFLWLPPPLPRRLSSHPPSRLPWNAEVPLGLQRVLRLKELDAGLKFDAESWHA